MLKGILIYNKHDFLKNEWFANQLINEANKLNIKLDLILKENIQLVIDKKELRILNEGKNLVGYDFAINRSRDKRISNYIENLGMKVFNSSMVTEVCNDKFRTHQYVNGIGISSVKTYLLNIENLEWFEAIEYPIILKTLDGHGGNEVFKINSFIELSNIIKKQPWREWILQEICDNEGVDLRVFVIGKKIVGAVKRYSNNSFKANVSLGGFSEKYSLNNNEVENINKIIGLMDFDFVGIDFLINNARELLFNEIEDAVGSRTLYQHYNINVAKKYMMYIKEWGEYKNK